jgi:DNA-binding transcriptional MerR regulator
MVERGLTIQDVAKLTGLSQHTLRYYERIGLLDPVGRAPSGHRRYAAADIDWLEFLTRLRTTRMPIRRMQRFADLRRRGDGTVTERRALLEEHRREVEARMRALEADLAVINDKITQYEEMELRHATGVEADAA